MNFSGFKFTCEWEIAPVGDIAQPLDKSNNKTSSYIAHLFVHSIEEWVVHFSQNMMCAWDEKWMRAFYLHLHTNELCYAIVHAITHTIAFQHRQLFRWCSVRHLQETKLYAMHLVHQLMHKRNGEWLYSLTSSFCFIFNRLSHLGVFINK